MGSRIEGNYDNYIRFKNYTKKSYTKNKQPKGTSGVGSKWARSWTWVWAWHFNYSLISGIL